MSLAIDEIISILRDGGHLTEPKALQAAAKDLLAAEREAKAEKADAPKRGKTRLVGFVRQDPTSPTLGGVYLISVPDTDGPERETYHGEALLNRLRKAAKEYEDSPRKRRAKGRPTKIETWDQLFRHVPAKILKQSGSQIGVKGKGNAHELVVLEKETLT